MTDIKYYSLKRAVTLVLQELYYASPMQAHSLYSDTRTLARQGEDGITWPSEFTSGEAPELSVALERMALRLLSVEYAPNSYPEFMAFFDRDTMTAATTLVQVIDAIEFIATAFGVPPNGFAFRWDYAPETVDTYQGMVDGMQERFPHLIFAPAVYDDYSGLTTQIRVNPDAISEPNRRFIDSAIPTQSIAVGSRVRIGSYDIVIDGAIRRHTAGAEHWAMRSSTLDHDVPALANIEDRITRWRRNRIEELRSGYRSNMQPPAPDPQEEQRRRDAATARYQTWRDGGGLAPSTDMVIPTLPFVPTGTPSSRRWGIEIETGAGRDLSGVPESWDSKDDGSLESAYRYQTTFVHPDNCPDYSHDIETYLDEVELDDGSTYQVWTGGNGSRYSSYVNPEDCESCGTVENDDYDDDDCVELVSPILTSAHSRGLKQITDDLENAPRSDTAGIHVHVEASDLTVDQIRALILAYDRIEPLIESSYDRVERGYCKRRSASELLAVAREAKSVKDVRDLRKGNRYVTVNLQALESHGTIEFRAMGPRYNYDHLVRWAMFCREMVNVAASGATMKQWSKVKDWEGVLKMFEKYGNEYNIALGVSVVEEPQAELVAV